MVLTQLQLKWPNHSTHLLTGLKSLFQNEQLVDCTLKCNKHTLKVHRSVLAACSPYFERELENNPSIVIRDMQFNVLQALIEFMYYGETRISEENFASLIEAAKLFEVKGLSEMDLLTSAETNNIISSIIAANGANYEKSPSVVGRVIFESDANAEGISATHKSLAPDAIPNGGGVSMIEDGFKVDSGEDSNSNLTAEESVVADSCQPHACRNFVVTPPQTESAQILLSLARSYNEKQQYFNAAATSVSASVLTPTTSCTRMTANASRVSSSVVASTHAGDHDYNYEKNMQAGDTENNEMENDNAGDDNALFNGRSNAVTSEMSAATSVSTKPREKNCEFQSTSDVVVVEQQLVATESFPPMNGDDATTMTAVSPTTVTATCLHATYNSSDKNDREFTVPERTSLLASLLAGNSLTSQSKTGSQSSTTQTKSTTTTTTTTTLTTINQSAVENGETKNNFELQSDVILGCPLLIETNDGYVDVTVDNMFNVFENGEIFEPSVSKMATTLKIITPNIECVDMNVNIDDEDRDKGDESDCGNGGSARVQVEELYNDDVLERIKREDDEDDELKEDPGAVVLRRINESGQLEKYVLSSADIGALKTMMEKRKQRPSGSLVDTAATMMTTDSSHIEVEVPASGGSASLITRIISIGIKVENAISKLPFKKSGGGGVAGAGSGCATTEMGSNSGCCSHGGEQILDESSLTVEAHHHENMFEELDNQFNMDCSIENIQREYVAYEEASKNETQLDHNYYANALKDEDEECVVINDNYDLSSLMLIEEPIDGTRSTSPLVSVSNNNSQRKNANVLLPSPLDNSSFAGIIPVTATAASDGNNDVYPNGRSDSGNNDGQPLRRNGIVSKVVSVPVPVPVPPLDISEPPLPVSVAVPLSIPIFNGKCDLILNNDDLIGSVLNTAMMTSTTSTAVISRAFTTASTTITTNSTRPSFSCTFTATTTTSAFTTNSSINSVPTKGSRIINGSLSCSKSFGNDGDSKRKTRSCLADHGATTLPFKKIKNSNLAAVASTAMQNEKKLRRTYRRKSNSSTEGVCVKNQNARASSSTNANALYENNATSDCNLIEEIIVDEIS